jgi:citrate synthase
MNDEFLTTKEAAEKLGVVRSTLYNYVDRGLLTIYKARTGAKQSYFKREEVEKLIGFAPAEEVSPKEDRPAA